MYVFCMIYLIFILENALDSGKFLCYNTYAVLKVSMETEVSPKLLIIF